MRREHHRTQELSRSKTCKARSGTFAGVVVSLRSQQSGSHGGDLRVHNHKSQTSSRILLPSGKIAVADGFSASGRLHVCENPARSCLPGFWQQRQVLLFPSTGSLSFATTSVLTENAEAHLTNQSQCPTRSQIPDTLPCTSSTVSKL